jgi:hypothetical protein
VLVERPRRRNSKTSDARAVRRRDDFDGPARLGMRAGYGYRELNENIKPLRRYLHSQAGRPWAKVYSEICAQIDRRSTVQQHIHQHIDDFIATDVDFSRDDGFYQPLYVDPKSGLIRVNTRRTSWKQYKRQRREKEAARVSAFRRVIDTSSMLLKLDGCWFLVEVAALPERTIRALRNDGVIQRVPYAEARFDVVMKRRTSRLSTEDDRRRKQLYGRVALYAVSKRQISRREIDAFELRTVNAG